MKIQLISDLHVEYHADGGKEFLELLKPVPEVDMVVIAGDIANQLTQKSRADLLSSLARMYSYGTQILIVWGNHDFWGPLSPWKLRVHRNIPYLSGRMVSSPTLFSYKDRRFIAGTMWFPQIPPGPKPTNDYTQIPEFEPWVYEQNRDFHEFLVENLEEGDIVVTHYLPCPQSIHPRYAASKANCGFMSDESELILARRPALWLHGHTHDSFDYMLGSTRVVCNPHGYPWEMNPKFDPKLVIEV